MLLISDTNILSSFAAGDAFYLFNRIFPKTTIHIPPSVKKELQTGLAYGKQYLAPVLHAIDGRNLKVLRLTKNEQQLARNLPKKLNKGECQAIALSKARKGQLMTNDKRAVRYCQQNGIKVLDLPVLLRLLWTRKIISQAEVRQLMERMWEVENLRLSENALSIIFGPN